VTCQILILKKDQCDNGDLIIKINDFKLLHNKIFLVDLLFMLIMEEKQCMIFYISTDLLIIQMIYIENT